MKTCEEYIVDMNLSIDGLLDPEAEQALQAHLATCPKCRSLYQSYRDIQDAFIEGEVEPPKGLSHSVMTRIHQEKVRHSPKATLKRMRFTLTAAVIALVVVAAGKYIGTPHGSTAASSTPEFAAAAEAPETAANQEAAFGTAPEVAAPPEAKAGAETTEDTAEYAAENAAPMLEAGYSAMEDAEPTDAPTDSMWIVWNALKQDGYTGTLYFVDTTEQELFRLLPQAEILALSSGDLVYQVSASAYQPVQDQLPAVQEMDADTPGDTVYLSIETQ